MTSHRVRAERKRLLDLARAAGLDADALMYEASEHARTCDRLDHTELFWLRHLLDQSAVEHRAPDGFGVHERDAARFA